MHRRGFRDHNATGCGLGGESSPATASNPIFLTEKQCAELVKSLAGDRRMSVLSEPRLITLNGQTASLLIQSENLRHPGETAQCDGKAIMTPKTVENDHGPSSGGVPAASADRRSIRVNVKVAETERAAAASRPASPRDCCEGCPACVPSVQAPAVNTQSVEKTVVIPDGGTTLILGPRKTVEVRTEYSAPVISRIPYVDGMFRNVGYAQETRQMIVLGDTQITA